MENWNQSHCSRNHLRCFHSHLLYFYRFKNPHFWSSTSEPRTLNCHWKKKKTFHFRLYFPFFIAVPLSFLILKLFHAVISNKQPAVERLKVPCVFLISRTFKMSEVLKWHLPAGSWWNLVNNGVFSSYRLMHTDQQLQCTLHIYLEGKKEVAVTLGSNVCSIKRIFLDQFQKGLN